MNRCLAKRFLAGLLLTWLPTHYGFASGGNWTMLFSQTRLSPKWGVHGEFQYRSYEVLPNTEQLMLRAGLIHYLNRNSATTLGYAYVPNYAIDKQQNPGIQVGEQRVWQQFQLRHRSGRMDFEHRFRLEQRWLSGGGEQEYLNRARYLLRVSVTLNEPEPGPNTWFLSAYNEVFLHLAKFPFDRNRLYGALGYQWSDAGNVQLGYLAQTVGSTTRHYLQSSLFLNLSMDR